MSANPQRDEFGNAQSGQTEATNRFIFIPNLTSRHRRGRIWAIVFLASTIVGVIALTALIVTILNDSFGYAAIQFTVQPETLAPGEKTLEQMTCPELASLLEENISPNRFRQIQSEKPF